MNSSSVVYGTCFADSNDRKSLWNSTQNHKLRPEMHTVKPPMLIIKKNNKKEQLFLGFTIYALVKASLFLSFGLLNPLLIPGSTATWAMKRIKLVKYNTWRPNLVPLVHVRCGLLYPIELMRVKFCTVCLLLFNSVIIYCSISHNEI